MLHFTLRLLSTLKYQYMFVFVQHLETYYLHRKPYKEEPFTMLLQFKYMFVRN